jgi:hypothetical protein
MQFFEVYFLRWKLFVLFGLWGFGVMILKGMGLDKHFCWVFEGCGEGRQKQKQNAGVSPLRPAMKLRDFGRDDTFFDGSIVFG